MKLYVVKGYSVNMKNKNSLTKRIENFVGYFTNFKEVYKRFDPQTIPSYSTIGNRLKLDNYYMITDSIFFIDNKALKFQEIVIQKTLANQVYHNSQYINIEKYVKQDLRLNEYMKFKDFDL